MNLRVQSFHELEVYKCSFDVAMLVFRLSKDFPPDERFSLTDQIRRSSRSIGANLAEAWAKRRYPAHFLSKLTDADGELQETRHWVEVAQACDYLDPAIILEVEAGLNRVGRLIGATIREANSFCEQR